MSKVSMVKMLQANGSSSLKDSTATLKQYKKGEIDTAAFIEQYKTQRK